MRITRTSLITGTRHTRELDVTMEQLRAWHQGTLAQHAFPQLCAEDREFIISGTTATEWATLGPEETTT